MGESHHIGFRDKEKGGLRIDFNDDSKMVTSDGKCFQVSFS